MSSIDYHGGNVKPLDALRKLELIEGTGEVLQDIDDNGKPRPWHEKKAETKKLAELYDLARIIEPTVITESRLYDLSKCADTLIFAKDAAGKKRLASGNFCHVRFCPMCNWRRSLKLAIQMGQAAALINSERKVRYVFVTLTCRNVPAGRLKQQLNALNAAWKRLLDGKSNTRLRTTDAETLRRNVLGYMRAVEITYNHKVGNYHPHIHALLAVKPAYFTRDYLTHEKFIELWRAAMRVDYAPSVNVQAVKHDKKAIAEVSKYPVKTYDLNKLAPERAARVLIVLTNATRNRRLLTFGGIIRAARQRLKQDDGKDLIHMGDEKRDVFLPVALVVYRYRENKKKYIC